MGLAAVIGLVKAARGIVKLISDPKAKAEAEAKLLDTQLDALSESYELERQLLSSKEKIIVAEAQSESFLTRTWRPITMLSLVAVTLGVIIRGEPIPADIIPLPMWGLLKLGVGGYIGSRGAEKIVPKIIEAVKRRF